jgi:hypothetical protein
MFIQHGPAAWTCSVDILHEDIAVKHRNGHAAWTTSMGMQHGDMNKKHFYLKKIVVAEVLVKVSRSVSGRA